LTSSKLRTTPSTRLKATTLLAVTFLVSRRSLRLNLSHRRHQLGHHLFQLGHCLQLLLETNPFQQGHSLQLPLKTRPSSS
jgi:hypothetical protein